MESIVNAGLYIHIDIFLVIMVRILGFFILMPILSASNIPALYKIMLAMPFAYIIFTTAVVADVYYNSVFGFFMLIAKEFFVGFIMAFVVFFVFSIIHFVGQLIDYQLGFSMALVFDPLTSMQVPVIGYLLYFFMAALFIQMGGLNVFISALIYSYEIIPIGSGYVLGNQPLMGYLLNILTQFFVLGMKLALPVVGTIFVIDVTLGLLVKAVPQMNIFVVGVPIKILFGFLLLYFITPYFVGYFNEIYKLTMQSLYNVIGGMAS